jgi:hypothetical protein
MDGLKNGKTGVVCVHGWQGTRVTLGPETRGPETQVLRARHGRIVSDRHGYPLVSNDATSENWKNKKKKRKQHCSFSGHFSPRVNSTDFATFREIFAKFSISHNWGKKKSLYY